MTQSKSNQDDFIAVFLNPEQSGYNASLTLTLGLKNRGHRVVYIGYPRFEELMRDLDFEFISLLDKDTYMGLVKKPGSRAAWELSRRMKEGVEQWLETETPALVLLDQFTWEQAGAFLKNNIPIQAINTCLAGFYNPSVPPVFSAIVPDAGGKANGIKNRIAWEKLRLFHWVISKINKKVMAPFLADIRENGVDISWGEYGRRLQIPELVLCPREFDFPIAAQSFDQRIYAGACVANIPDDNSNTFDWNQIDTTKTIVYCSVGSHPWLAKNRRKLFSAAINALKERPHLFLILQASNPKDLEQCHPLPANVSVREWVPQMEILSRASLFITHGGLSSVRESIFHGVPMLVFPWGVDQPGNGARVEYHNLGQKGNAAKVTPAVMGRMMDDILKNPNYAEATAKMQAIFRQQEDCKTGIEVVEQMLS
jgi:MGT family glycosyltransferase